MSNLSLPDAFGSVTALGEPQCVYRPTMLNKLIYLASALICVLIALALAYYGLVYYPQEFQATAASNSPYIVGCGGIFLLLALYLAWRVLSRWNETAVVYRDGFAYSRGGEPQTLRWNEVDSISMRVVRMSYYGVIPAGTQRNYTIVGTNGVRLKLDEMLSKVEDLVDRIREEAFQHILARCQAAFDAGQPVAFGPIRISQAQGIQKGNKSYAWGDIAQAGVADGNFTVKPKQRSLFGGLSAPVASIPNVDVLVAMVQGIAARYRKAA